LPDELDFDEFYTASFRRIVSQIYAMTGNLAEAEDSVQEAYARAWQRWDDVRKYGDPEAWIRTVAYRLSVSAWRKAVNRRTAHRGRPPRPTCRV
jgi:RNA polymerase sigma-70 factor (ECF subfamily)